MFQVVFVHAGSLRLVARESPLVLGPGDESLIVPNELAIHKAHDATGELPHFATHFLQSEEDVT